MDRKDDSPEVARALLKPEEAYMKHLHSEEPKENLNEPLPSVYLDPEYDYGPHDMGQTL